MHRRQASSRKRIREAAPPPQARRRAETTARKEALERLREREQLFRSLLENSSDLMALLGADGALLYVAPSCQRIMGYRSEDAVGRSGFELMHPEDQEPARRLLQWLVQRPGEQASVEYRYRHQNGSWRWLEGRARNLLEEPSVGAIIINSRDVTDRKRAAEAIQAGEEKLQAILNASPDIMCRVRRDGTLLDIRGNVVLSNPEAPVGRSVIEWHAPEDWEAALRVVQQTLGTGALQTFETKFVGADGVRYFESRIVPWGVDEVISTVRDVTERRRVEDELRYERDFNSAVLDTVGALVVVLDPKGRIVRLNRAAERTTGYTCEEVKGRFIWEVLSVPDDRAPAQRFFEQVEAARLPGELESYCRTKHGDQRLVAWSKTVITNAQGLAYIIGAGIDITERRRAEEEARRRESELAHVARLSTMGEMAAVLAHELNQPLSAIVNFASGCVRRIESGTARSRDLVPIIERMAEQAVRGGEIIRRLRRFVRKGLPQRQPVDLNPLVREAVGLAEVEARQQGISIRLELAAGTPTVMGDSILIEQVVVNLVRNGIDAMKDDGGGELSVRTTLNERKMIEVAVSDDGPGTTGVGEQAYEAFFSTKKSGLGIGLSISRSVVEAHGGQLWFTANPVRGTTFRFTLPVENEQPGDGR